MAEDAQIRARLAKACAEGGLVTCRIPNGGDLAIAVERSQVEEGMEAWHAMSREKREAVRLSVLRAIARTVERMKQKKASGAEIDALAADVTLWLGYELMYADGEAHLVKGPSPEELQKGPMQ